MELQLCTSKTRTCTVFICRFNEIQKERRIVISVWKTSKVSILITEFIINFWAAWLLHFNITIRSELLNSDAGRNWQGTALPFAFP